MSYEKVKRITIKKDKVFVTSACNNLRPLKFERWEVKGNDIDEQITNTLIGIVDGTLQLYNTEQNRKWLKVTDDEKVAELNHKIWLWSTPRDEALKLREVQKDLLLKRFKLEFNL